MSDGLHIGWLEPGRTVCLGAGPVRLRYTRKEAAVLTRVLRDMLSMTSSALACGCEPPEDTETGEAVSVDVAGLDEAQKRAALRARFGSWE